MIYTFYSYKGGVGRSMALANIAELLYLQGEDVLIADFDLEAPGLEDYFARETSIHKPSEIKGKRGVIDLLLSYKELRTLPTIESEEDYDLEKSKDGFSFPYPVEPLRNFITPIYPKMENKGSLSIIPAGVRADKNFSKYAERVRSFDWDDFYKNWDGELFFDWFREEVNKISNHILIDSRTGVTEMGGVCVYQLADTVVSFVASNKQNIEGTLKIANSLKNRELIEKSRKGREISLIFVPSRVEETAEQELLDDFIKNFNKTFSGFFDPLLGFEDNPYSNLKIPYIPYYSFMENVAVRDSSNKAEELKKAYDRLKSIVINQGIDTELAEDYLDEARKVWDENRDTRAIKLAEKATLIWKKLFKKDSQLYGQKLAQANTLLSDIFEKENEILSVEYAENAIKIYFELFEMNPSNLGEEVIINLTSLVNRLYEKGERETASDTLTRIIEIQKNTIGKIKEPDKGRIDIARNLYDLSNWLMAQEKFREALDAIKDAVDIYKNLEYLERDNLKADFADSLTIFSECLLEFNKIDDAKDNVIKAVEIYIGLYESSPKQYESKTVEIYNALLDILSRNEITRVDRSLNLVQDAEKFFRQVSEKNSKKYNPDLAKTINMLTDPLAKEGKLAEAVKKQKEAIAIFREISKSHSVSYKDDLAGSLINLSKYLFEIQDLHLAEKAVVEADVIYKTLAKNSPTRYKEELKETSELLNKIKISLSANTEPHILLNNSSKLNTLLQKDKLYATKPHLTIGTLGHIGHGKTTLTAAITAVLGKNNANTTVLSVESIDNTPEEKDLKLSIIATRVEYETKNRHYVHIDCPGHADHIDNMITGAVQMDGAILVVATPEGPMPQTREHILISRQVGVPAIVIFLNKIDMVNDEEIVELVELEIRELLSAYDYSGDDVPVIKGSALKALEGVEKWEQAIIELMQAVDNYIPEPVREYNKPFLMPVENVFTISERGTLVTGKIERGIIRVNDPVEIIGLRNTQTSVATEIKTFNKIISEAKAGENIGILLRGIEESSIERGQVIAKPGTISSHTKFKAETYILKEEEGGSRTPFVTGYSPLFYFRTTDMTGVATLPDGIEKVMPGDNIIMDIELMKPIAMEEGLRFEIRDGGRTIGAGTISRIED